MRAGPPSEHLTAGYLVSGLAEERFSNSTSRDSCSDTEKFERSDKKSYLLKGMGEDIDKNRFSASTDVQPGNRRPKVLSVPRH
jgi:hypothetical protein